MARQLKLQEKDDQETPKVVKKKEIPKDPNRWVILVILLVVLFFSYVFWVQGTPSLTL